MEGLFCPLCCAGAKLLSSSWLTQEEPETRSEGFDVAGLEQIPSIPVPNLLDRTSFGGRNESAASGHSLRHGPSKGLGLRAGVHYDIQGRVDAGGLSLKGKEPDAALERRALSAPGERPR